MMYILHLYTTVIQLEIKSLLRVRAMVFNVTFNNISLILWRSVLLFGGAGVPGEITDLPQIISLNVVWTLHERDLNSQL
jgi:hypothetical protein